MSVLRTAEEVRRDVLTLQQESPDWCVGTSGYNLDVDAILDALATGQGGYLVLHPVQVRDLTLSLLATIGGSPEEGLPQLRETLALDVRGDASEPYLVGRVFGAEVWSWSGIRLTNCNADREGYLVGPVPVRIVTDA